MIEIITSESIIDPEETTQTPRGKKRETLSEVLQADTNKPDSHGADNQVKREGEAEQTREDSQIRWQHTTRGRMNPIIQFALSAERNREL